MPPSPWPRRPPSQEGKRLIYGVFDGMGGEANGEQAALLCAQTLHRCSSDGRLTRSISSGVQTSPYAT